MVDPALMEMWREHPDVSHDVVILMRLDDDHVPTDVLELEGVEPIPYQTGMFRANLTGAELMQLAARSEVEDIAPDEEVEAF